METNEKIERLLDMIEHPEHYTEEEMQKILADKETREYYSLERLWSDGEQINITEYIK